MPQIKEIFYENILFKFETHSCTCAEDIQHISLNAHPVKNLKIQSLPQKNLLFAYAAKDGLVRIAPNGTIAERNILGSLLSLADKPSRDLIMFFRDNGFLFPVSSDAYEAFDNRVLYGIINRLKETVELMTAVSEIRKDYQKICTLMISLLFADPIEVKTDSMKEPYKSSQHEYVCLIMNPPMNFSSIRKQEAFDGSYFHIQDSIYDSCDLKVSDCNEIMGGYASVPNYSNDFYQRIVALYVNYSVNDINKKITDFLFHFLYDMHGDSSVTFSDQMKEALIDISKYVIGEEINANLDGIHPVYNSETMAPSWKVDTLLCAIYFSLFYLKPDLELYRPCDNPKCQKYFLVKTTSTRNRFCSVECCNRVTQDRYRKRKREREGI